MATTALGNTHWRLTAYEARSLILRSIGQLQQLSKELHGRDQDGVAWKCEELSGELSSLYNGSQDLAQELHDAFPYSEQP